jgi:hypothetical protein
MCVGRKGMKENTQDGNSESRAGTHIANRMFAPRTTNGS